MTGSAATHTFSAARASSRMIGQQEAWEKLSAAIAPGADDRCFKIVLLKGRGGMGKTRLLEEALRVFRPDVPADHDPNVLDAPLTDPIISDIVDVIDARLHDRYRFILALHESLQAYGGALDFRNFRSAMLNVNRLGALGALQDKMTEAQEAAARAFLGDLAAITAQRRVAFLVDTVERLSYEAWEWLLAEGLLKASDVDMRTHQWLRSLISGPRSLSSGQTEGAPLANVTLVLAGRGPNTAKAEGITRDPVATVQEQEGESFFRSMRYAQDKASGKGLKYELVDIDLKRLSINETREYFAQLAEDQQRLGNRRVAGDFAAAAAPDRDHHKVIALYTGGLPIRLALYADVIARGKSVPKPLLESFETACATTDAGDPATIDPTVELPEKVSPALDQARWEIEGQFITLLFSQPDDLYSQVLLALVRAPRGLTAEQLHFWLDSPPDQDPARWRPNRARLAELVALLHEIEADHYLGKRRAIRHRSTADDPDLPFDENYPEASTYRVGLQDEIYRIYGEHMGLLAEPRYASLDDIREALKLSPERMERYHENHRDEQEERQKLYMRLTAFADWQYRHYLELKRRHLRDDEERFEAGFVLNNAQTYAFPNMIKRDARARLALLDALAVAEIERMVYKLLLDPQANFNVDYIMLEDDNDRAARQEEDFWAQAEMWRVLHDPYLMKFSSMPGRRLLEERGETPLHVLQRVAEQENVSRWIKRFVLRGSYRRAVEFGDAVEEVIKNWPRETAAERWKWNSWNHTVARAERSIWRNRARIRLGEGGDDARKEIEESVKRLRLRYTSTVATELPGDDGVLEYGFRGAAGIPDHPAYPRLRRLLSHAHNILGFSHRSRGNMEEAIKDYGSALEYVRRDRKGLMDVHRAVVLNNLARALSEVGWNALGVCLDGLVLRREQAEEVPLAGSLNTLALLYDDMGRYEDAPLLAAKAIAYCRRASEDRQLGLALRQMAESLRHVAERLDTGQRVIGRPDDLYAIASDLLDEAYKIFQSMDEHERLIEVNIEMGSLHRDQMRLMPDGKPPADWQENYKSAQQVLDEAIRLAQQRDFDQHVMDARINQARIHYHADRARLPKGDPQAVNRAIDVLRQVEASVEEEYLITSETPDPTTRRNQNWIFRHLSTAQMIYGWIAMDRFQDIVDQHKAQYPDDTDEHADERARQVAKDPDANRALKDAATAYAMGIAYAELYSPRSRSIASIQNDLYGRLRKSNRYELESFGEQLKEVRKDYPNLRTVVMLEKFLLEFFGPDIDRILQTEQAGNAD